MRKYLCMVLAFIIICTYITVVYAEDSENNLTDLQTQQQDLQNQLNESNEQLEEVQSQLSENLQQIEKLDEKIQESESKITELDAQVSQLQAEISDIQAKLEVAEKNYEKQKDIMEKRLIAIYESGDTNYIDVLLKSSDLSEFLSNYYLISEITSLDRELLDEVETEKKEIELSKQKLEKNQASLATALQTQTQTATVLQNTKTLKSYHEKIAIRSLATNKSKILSEDDKIRKWVIHKLMCTFHVSKEEFSDLYGHHFDTYFAESQERISSMESTGLLQNSSSSITVTPLGELFVRVIATAFDHYFLKSLSSVPKFSKSI